MGFLKKLIPKKTIVRILAALAIAAGATVAGMSQVDFKEAFCSAQVADK